MKNIIILPTTTRNASEYMTNKKLKEHPSYRNDHKHYAMATQHQPLIYT